MRSGYSGSSNGRRLHDGSYIRKLILDGSMRNEKCARKSPKVGGSPKFLSNIGVFGRVQYTDFFTNWRNKLNNLAQYGSGIEESAIPFGMIENVAGTSRSVLVALSLQTGREQLEPCRRS